METKTRAVTIVVPVYADWPAIEACVQSIKDCVDLSIHHVLFVNDCGPEADEIEKNLKAAIQGDPSLQYFRNPTNVGFGQTCNRAVLELDKTKNDILLLNSDTKVTPGFLDEMQAVLALSEKHGCVSPRSNNATIASVPLIPKDNQSIRGDVGNSLGVYQQVKDLLPRFSVVPVTIGFCMLIRRQLIDNFGLFDEKFGLGYAEENDFCLRVNKYGYSSVLANRAYVHHLETRSFAPDIKERLQFDNHNKLLKRYPFYEKIIRQYLYEHVDPIDRFADVIANPAAPTKVLIDLFHMPLIFNGTSRNAISLLAYVRDHLGEFPDVQFTVLANCDAIKFHDLKSYGIRVIDPSQLDELFHVGYCPSQIFHIDNLFLLNRCCLRVVFSLLDIISVRTTRLLGEKLPLRDIILDSFKLADKVVAISDYTRDDAMEYYGEMAESWRAKFVTIHQGYPGSNFPEENGQRYLMPTEVEQVAEAKDYILVYGNDFPHKMVQEIVPVLAGNPHQFLIVGPRVIKSPAPNVHLVPSGRIPDSVMQSLIKNAKAVLFSSTYEGFGFPLAEAAFFEKPIVAFDSAVTREVAGMLGIEPLLFATIDDLGEKIDQALTQGKEPRSGTTVRLLDDYNRDVVALVLEVGRKRSVDPSVLRDRWHYFTKLDTYIAYALKHRRRKPPTPNEIRKRVQYGTLAAWKRRAPESYRIFQTGFRGIKPKK